MLVTKQLQIPRVNYILNKMEVNLNGNCLMFHRRKKINIQSILVGLLLYRGIFVHYLPLKWYTVKKIIC